MGHRLNATYGCSYTNQCNWKIDCTFACSDDLFLTSEFDKNFG